MLVAVEPQALLALTLVSSAYARGTARIWCQVGRGRVVRHGHVAAGVAAVVALTAAFVGPVEALAGRLLTAHMTQHVLLAVIAAPLLVLAAPSLPLLQGLPHRLRRPAARVHRRLRRLRSWTHTGGWPLAAVGLYAAVNWLWHLPGPYEAALDHGLLHAAEHVSMLGAGVLVWWTVLHSGRRSHFGYGTGIAVVFLTGLQHAGLGGVLSLAPSVLYPRYAGGGAGLSGLEDQQFAGMLMWAPSKLIHGVAVVLLVVAWLRAVDARARAREAGASDAS